MDLFADPPFGPDTEAVADQQHADHQFRVDRGPAGVAVKRDQMLTNAAEVDEAVNSADQVILRDMIFKRELVEQRTLATFGAGRRGPVWDNLASRAVGPVEQKLQPILFSMAPRNAAQEGRDHDE